MREYDGSVFSETINAAVMQHIKYGVSKNIPWGISESQYYRFDLDSNYQYKAFWCAGTALAAFRKPISCSCSVCNAPGIGIRQNGSAVEFEKIERFRGIRRIWLL